MTDYLSEYNIAILEKLPPNALKTVAVIYMGLEQDEVEQIEGIRHIPDYYSKKVIERWRNKDITNNNKRKLANILHDSGIVSDEVINKVLGNYQFTPILFPNPTNEPTLTRSELGRLVKGITIQDMKSLAVGPLGFTEVDIKNIEAQNRHYARSDTWSVIFELFVKWSNKSGSTRQKLIEILRKSGKMRQDLIREILGDGEIEADPGTSSPYGESSQPISGAYSRTHAADAQGTLTEEEGGSLYGGEMSREQAAAETSSEEDVHPCKNSLKEIVLDFLAQKGLPPEKVKNATNCPMTMYKNGRKYNATVSNGEARTLQGDGSHVSLSIPEGSQGIYMTGVNNDHMIPHIIPDEECIVGPLAEVEHLRSESQLKGETKKRYELKIPHCIQKRELWQDIRVRRAEVNMSGEWKLEQLHWGPRRDDYYEVDDHYITIYTSHFCLFTCTSCTNTCHATVMTFLVGKLSHNPKHDVTKVKVKAFLCSNLHCIEDFRKKWLKIQEEYNLKELEEQGIDIETEPFDPLNSQVTMTFCAADIGVELWGPTKKNDLNWTEIDSVFKQSLKLSSAMLLEDCHLCKIPYPKDAMTVDLMCREITDQFDGVFDLVIHAAKGTGEQNEKGEKKTKIEFEDHPLQIDFTVTKDSAIPGDGGAPQTAAGMESGPTETPCTGTSSSADACSQPTSKAQRRIQATGTNETSTVSGSRTQTSPSEASGGASGNRQPSKGEKLTSARLLKLSRYITSESDLRNLATIGLGIEEHKVNKELNNNRHDITTAAHAVLKSWKNTQSNGQEAYVKMCDALEHEDVGLKNLINEIAAVKESSHTRTPYSRTSSPADACSQSRSRQRDSCCWCL